MRDEWRTPQYVLRHVAVTLDVPWFDYDTACTLEDAIAPPIWKGESTTDALRCRWLKLLWCNPPYSAIPTWVKYALGQAEHPHTRIVLLLPSPNGEKIYQSLLMAGNVQQTHVIGRIAFLNSAGVPRQGNPRGSSLFYLNCNHIKVPKTYAHT
ncbi:MAG: DNA N-6-adenine-methyltransferase [Nitrososphaera sp.]